MSNCGDCTLCCKLLAIPELAKPTCQWCQHTTPNKHGCGIYQDRPNSCRDFECLWLQSSKRALTVGMGDDMRPDKSKVVMMMGGDANQSLVLHVDPGFRGAWSRDPKIMRVVNSFLAAGKEVLVVTGESRQLLTPTPESVKKVARDEPPPRKTPTKQLFLAALAATIF